MSLKRLKLNPKLANHETNWSQCQRCPLGKTADTHVLYRGSIPAQVLFIGEAPGYAEDAVGKPFVGQSGKLLDKIIFETHRRTLLRYTYCITNVVACVPWRWDRDPPANKVRNTYLQDMAEVRPPSKEEAAACSPRVLELINLCQPTAIVTLGKPAAKYVPSSPEKYERCELVHPAFLLRQSNMELDLKRCILKLSAFISKVL